MMGIDLQGKICHVKKNKNTTGRKALSREGKGRSQLEEVIQREVRLAKKHERKENPLMPSIRLRK